MQQKEVQEPLVDEGGVPVNRTLRTTRQGHARSGDCLPLHHVYYESLIFCPRGELLALTGEDGAEEFSNGESGIRPGAHLHVRDL